MNSISNRVFLVIAATLSFVVAVNSLGLSALAARPHVVGSRSEVGRSGRSSTATPGFAKLGVTFEENLGQMPPSVKFISRSGGTMTFLADDGAWFYLPEGRANLKERNEGFKTQLLRSASAASDVWPSRTDTGPRKQDAGGSFVKMGFEGANPTTGLSGERELQGKINYLRGSDPSKWITNVPTFGSVRYRGIYDGVDLLYYGNESGQMEYDLELAPGADISKVNLKFSGAENVRIDEANGDLVLTTEQGELRHHRPVAFQLGENGKQNVEANYQSNSEGKISFSIGAHDASRPLVIDPIIGYSTYLGGSGDVDFANAVATDASGNAYLAGSTNSANFPTVLPFDGTFGGDQVKYDAFVTKMNASGTALVYSTYLGGSNDDNGVGIAVDGSGQAYVSGFTDSTNFPTANAFQPALNGTAYDGFLTKLNSTGSALIYSTYIGGTQNDSALAVAIDNTGSAHITGETSSTNYPVAAPFQSVFGGGASDALVTKFNPAGNTVAFSTYLGGSSDDLALGIALNANGVYLAGATTSTNFPVLNAMQPTYGGGGFFDGFVTKMNPFGTGLVFSTYLGGSDYDGAKGIGLDANGHACITGVTASSNFPVISAFQSTRNGTVDDAFVTRISSSGALLYSTYLGGTGVDQGSSVAVDASGAAYITGTTRSTNFPKVDPIQASLAGESDAFVTKVSPTGSTLEFSTYIGGSSFDDGVAIAVDSGQNAYVAGGTDSSNFPTVNPFQAARSGASDGFLLRISSSTTTISGQVFTSSGQGLRNAIVTLKDQFGVRIQAPTSSLGFYSFTGVTPGQPYELTVASRRFRFDAVNITPNQSLVTVNFNGLE
jgi:hypothetical protein